MPHARRLQVIFKTLNPEWDETLEFRNLTLEKVLQTPLVVHAWDKDGFTSRDDSLGGLSVTLERLQTEDTLAFEERLPTQGTLAFSVEWAPDTPRGSH